MKDLRNLSLVFSMLAAGLAACDPAPDPSSDPDGGSAGPDAACETWYLDQDEDGHGDANDLGIRQCGDPPAGRVDNNGDCNDNDEFVHPGHPEVCDNVDNDCSGAREASCPTGCTITRDNDDHLYLYCTNALTWSAARTVCQGQAMDLVRIDSALENAYLRALIPVGIEHWIGATDAADEGVWRWIDNGEQFWSGNQAGTPVGGLFAGWISSYPDGADAIDCGRITGGTLAGGWLDAFCSAPSSFICERN